MTPRTAHIRRVWVKVQSGILRHTPATSVHPYSAVRFQSETNRAAIGNSGACRCYDFVFGNISTQLSPG